MSFAVFLRAANVGGHNVFKPAEVAKQMPVALGVKNLGAAGTYAVRGGADEAAVRKAFATRVPVACDIAVRSAEDLRALVARAPLAGITGKPFVSVLLDTPPAAQLPVERGHVQLLRVDAGYALSVVLPDAKPGADVNGLVERTLGVGATTRGWPTMEKLAALLG